MLTLKGTDDAVDKNIMLCTIRDNFSAIISFAQPAPKRKIQQENLKESYSCKPTIKAFCNTQSY